MEDTINQFIEETWEAHTEVLNLSLELLLDKLDDLDVKADFNENPTLVSNETIHKVELKAKELSKEEQEPTDKLEERAEVKKNVVNILKGSKSQQKVRKHKKNDKTFIKINGFYNCPECLYKTKDRRRNLQIHIDAVHLKLKPWKCLDCAKGIRIKNYYFKCSIK